MKRGSQNFQCQMICGPFSQRIAFRRSRYRKPKCKNALCILYNESTDVVSATRVFSIRDSAVSCSHWKDFSWSMVSFLLFSFNTLQILAARCALKTCTRNSSPMLNTLTDLSTCKRRTYSRRLHNEPVCDGDPQKILKMTRKHSHKKWKSPVLWKVNVFTAMWCLC